MMLYISLSAKNSIFPRMIGACKNQWNDFKSIIKSN